MACTKEYIDFVCRQLAGAGEVTTRKMMGDYVIYVDGKCVVTACDGMCYVKIHPAIEELMKEAERGRPYEGASMHYLLDVTHSEEAVQVVRRLAEVLPYPKRRPSAGKNPKM